MPNWCNTKIYFTGKKENLDLLHKDLIEFCRQIDDNKESSSFKNFMIFKKLAKKEELINGLYTRSNIEEFNLKDDGLLLTLEEAWNVNPNIPFIFAELYGLMYEVYSTDFDQYKFVNTDLYSKCFLVRYIAIPNKGYGIAAGVGNTYGNSYDDLIHSIRCKEKGVSYLKDASDDEESIKERWQIFEYSNSIEGISKDFIDLANARIKRKNNCISIMKTIFMDEHLTDGEMLRLIAAFNTMYLNTDQDMEEFSVEFNFVVDSILNNRVPIELTYLSDFIDEVCDIVPRIKEYM